jgi:hypothetical protein
MYCWALTEPVIDVVVLSIGVGLLSGNTEPPRAFQEAPIFHRTQDDFASRLLLVR